MYKKLRIESKLSNLGVVENAIDDNYSEIWDQHRKIMERYWFLYMEAVNNAIVHGNKSDTKEIC
ncbi:MAG: hypothetical protein MZV63_29425 [Marinilabiliales bacterium]|nr:hypothetical protein [Marinilabiliales bacterium]